MTSDKFTEQVVNGPYAGQPGYSLLLAADTVSESAANRELFGHGAKWAPEQIGGGGATGINCPGNTASMGEATNPALTTADPFVVWAEDHCSTIGFKDRDYEGRGRRQLDATQSFSIAREFQLGTIRTSETLNNYALVDATQIHPGDVSILQAVATLESALGDTFKGRRCMIHVPPESITLLADSHVLNLVGQRWMTPMGTIVCADAGYTHESDGYLYAYGTGPVQVLLGRVDLNPGSLEAAWDSGAVDYKVNKVRIYAERSTLVLVDGGVATTAGSGSADAMFKVQLGESLWATHS